MKDYLIPTAPSETEFVEKRSRFIGHVMPVETEKEARDFIATMKSKYHDARHNCWCYHIREGGIMRYSDDGEPQGTAGQPMLEVFKREGIENYCFVSTRYFGGILLGAGGLLRAYTRSAKDALDAAGVSIVRPWELYGFSSPYHLFEQVKRAVLSVDGVIEELDYAVDIGFYVLLPVGGKDALAPLLQELSAGTMEMEFLEERFQAVPRTEKAND